MSIATVNRIGGPSPVIIDIIAADAKAHAKPLTPDFGLRRWRMDQAARWLPDCITSSDDDGFLQDSDSFFGRVAHLWADPRL